MGTSADWFLAMVIFCFDAIFEHLAYAFAFSVGRLLVSALDTMADDAWTVVASAMTLTVSLTQPSWRVA